MGFTDNVKEIAKTAKETVVATFDPSTDPLDIRNILKTDHQLVAGMLDSLIEQCEGSDPQIGSLAQALRDELLLHAKTEEKALYEACKKHGKDVREFAQEGYREHELVELLLNQMVNERPGKDGELKATLSVLKEILDHHVREEEGDLFPKLAKEFSNDQLIEIGENMEALKAKTVIEPAPQNPESLH